MDLKGKVVVLTGKFAELNRKEAEKQLESMGAKCSGSVTSKTDVVFAGEKAGSKLATASALGIPVLGESDLQAILSGTEPGQAPVEVRPTTSLKELHKEGRVTFCSNTPHQTDLTGWNVSPDGRYFATGAWCGDDYEAGGSLAVWEVSTGRCVNVINSIPGGVGWPDESGILKWSNDSRRIGVAFDTNGVGYVDPFGKSNGITNVAYATDGLNRPPQWCWAPDSSRMFVSCWGYRKSALPGAIVAPSSHKNDPIYMALTGFENDPEEGPHHGTMSDMVWREDGVIVGSNYAIDTQTRQVAWSFDGLAGPSALSPDGKKIVFHDGGLKFLDAVTGKILAEPNHVGGGNLIFSRDSAWLLDVCHSSNADSVSESIRVYKGLEFVGMIEVECRPYRKDNAAFSNDNRFIAAMTADDTLVVFENKPNFPKVFEAPAYGADRLHFGDGAIILSSKQFLTFYRVDGELIAHHELFELPPSDPITSEITDPGLLAFSLKDEWGYVNSAAVVARNVPLLEVSAVVDRRYGYALGDLELPMFGTMEEAVKALPKSFSKAMQSAYGKNAGAKPKKSKSFLQPNTHSVQDLEEYLFKNCKAQGPRAAKFLAELALQKFLEGDLVKSKEYASAVVVEGNFDGAEALAHLAAYYARGGHREEALELLKRAEIGFQEWEDGKAILGAFFAGTHEILGMESPHKLSYAGPDHLGGRRIRPVALFKIWKKDIAGAAAAISSLSSSIWWHDLAELADAVLAYRDLDLLEEFLAGIAPGEHTRHFELMTKAIDLCLELDASRAFDLLEYFQGLGRSQEEDRILEHLASSDRAAFDAKVAKLASDRDFPETKAQLLRAQVKASPDHAQDLLLEFLQNLDPGKLHRYNGPGVAYAVAEVSLKTGNFDQASAMLRNLADCLTWAKVAAILDDDHPAMPEVVGGLIKSMDLGYLESILGLIKERKELIAPLVEALFEKVGRERYELESLVAGFALSGLLEESHAARMKLTKANRTYPSRHVVAGLIRAGEYTTALSVLEELEGGYMGTGGREYQLLHSLIVDVWESVPRISGVM